MRQAYDYWQDQPGSCSDREGSGAGPLPPPGLDKAARAGLARATRFRRFSVFLGPAGRGAGRGRPRLAATLHPRNSRDEKPTGTFPHQPGERGCVGRSRTHQAPVRGREANARAAALRFSFALPSSVTLDSFTLSPYSTRPRGRGRQRYCVRLSGAPLFPYTSFLFSLFAVRGRKDLREVAGRCSQGPGVVLWTRARPRCH